jgi:hypothetical protein
MPETLNSELPKFFSTTALADAARRKRVSVQACVRRGTIIPDAVLIQPHRKPIALFSERMVGSIHSALKHGIEIQDPNL